MRKSRVDCVRLFTEAGTVGSIVFGWSNLVVDIIGVMLIENCDLEGAEGFLPHTS